MSEEEKEELTELYENSEWWHNRFNAVQRDYENLHQRIDKAIEYIEQLPFNDLAPLEVKVIYKILGDKE